MSRGFAIGVSVVTADELTSEKIADEVKAQGLLTALESQTFLPAAIVAAQAMINAIGAGPYWVWLDGADNMATAGETTSLRVTVSSLATPPIAGAAPEAVTSTTGEATAPAPSEPVTAETPAEATTEPATAEAAPEVAA